MGEELTKNQRIFCDEYLKDRNGTRAYKRAYKTCKKESTAMVNASRLLSYAKIKAYIDTRLAKVSEKAGITTERIFKEEKRLAFSNLKELFDGPTIISPSELPEDIARAISGIKVKTRRYGEDETETTYEYKFWDKGQSLNRLHKVFGTYAAEEINVTGLDKLAERMTIGNRRLEKHAE